MKDSKVTQRGGDPKHQMWYRLENLVELLFNKCRFVCKDQRGKRCEERVQ